MPRKLGAIRQFSLQCEAPPASATARRASLKKQRSEEVGKEDASARISLSAKPAPRTPKPPIKVAWADDEPGARPAVQPFRRHSHHQTTDEGVGGAGAAVGKTALYSRQDLAQNFRLAWQDRENTKNKLNIFLAHNLQADAGEDLHSTRHPAQDRNQHAAPKIMQPLLLHQPPNDPSHNPSATNSNLKQIFQKHLRKSKMTSPGGSDSESGSQAVVVVPIIERSKPSTAPVSDTKPKRERSVPPPTAHETTEKKCEDKPARPQTVGVTPASGATATQRRAIFEKRTNYAFQSLNSTCTSPMPPTASRTFRAPMVRASSLPTSKPPDIQAKTRLRKKIKVYKRGKNHTGCRDQDDEKNSDVVTMVSLVSASESEAEDYEAKEVKECLKPQPATAGNQQHSSKKQTACSEKHFSLRKTVKQVSFQPSSIHAVRSFSASFPARRASVGASLLLDSAAKKLQKCLEKRGQSDEGLADAKRRLLQPDTHSSHIINSRHSDGDESARTAENVYPEAAQQDTPNIAEDHAESDRMKRNDNGSNASQDGGATLKERKCWETYCRMTKSGLHVSFDTILRGMLTPTEYRLRRRLSLQRAEEEGEHCELPNVDVSQ